MISIRKTPVPANSMLGKYTSVAGAYTDCYVTEIPFNVTFPEYVFAFYTTSLFKLERTILKFTVFKPSTDMDAKNLAHSLTDKFAAWTVESRSDDEILLCDFLSCTRSWLMVEKAEGATILYFGSAVVPKKGSEGLGSLSILLLGFHQVYSVLLLYFAKRRLLPKR
ncbi:MAG: hypothetical protein QY302_02500 [Anaerolineales bacterium]|nr:MAG: hypothetical protein QY302_02500 [Anaerolineales bacterium]